MSHRAIYLDGASFTAAEETPFATEAELHRIISARPDALPTEDLGLGHLVALAEELGEHISHNSVWPAVSTERIAGKPEAESFIREYFRGRAELAGANVDAGH